MESPSRFPLDFHRRLPGYQPTPLLSLPQVAKQVGVDQVLLKNEAGRFGLPAFKILGASWAVFQALRERLELAVQDLVSLEDIGRFVGAKHSLRISCATDGNHGRAVARVARILGIPARVHVPAGTTEQRMEAIELERAVVVMGGTYDESLKRAANDGASGALLIQDTGWDGYEKIPKWTVEGYSTMFWEVEDELERRVGVKHIPTHVFVQIGVGSLAAASVRHFRRKELFEHPVLIGVEPEGSDCVLESVKAGRIVQLPGAQHSIMAGLNCGTPSSVSFPELQKGIDCFLAVDDERAKEAVRLLAEVNVVSGETGAAGLAGLIELCSQAHIDSREALDLDRDSRVLLISTEGITDQEVYDEIIGKK
ncbi:MAG: diaminopropionate ammonia-lyase [Ignavibacteriales bacterium]|nr:diaminopropionate ammonia-lyase [Ignavibacteriales bacterium]